MGTAGEGEIGRLFLSFLFHLILFFEIFFVVSLLSSLLFSPFSFFFFSSPLPISLSLSLILSLSFSQK